MAFVTGCHRCVTAAAIQAYSCPSLFLLGSVNPVPVFRWRVRLKVRDAPAVDVVNRSEVKHAGEPAVVEQIERRYPISSAVRNQERRMLADELLAFQPFPAAASSSAGRLGIALGKLSTLARGHFQEEQTRFLAAGNRVSPCSAMMNPVTSGTVRIACASCRSYRRPVPRAFVPPQRQPRSE